VIEGRPSAAKRSTWRWRCDRTGAATWMKVFSDLKARGCEDILIAVTDGLKG
jgi:putative transposase